MTKTFNRSAALFFSALAAAALWLPTLSVPAAPGQLAVAHATVELA